MGRKKTLIPVVLREKITKAVLAVPPKVAAEETIEEALAAMKPAIQSMLDKGYTRADVIEKLAKEGLVIKLFHLKAALSVPQERKTE